jgi:hypothetical protein
MQAVACLPLVSDATASRKSRATAALPPCDLIKSSDCSTYCDLRIVVIRSAFLTRAFSILSQQCLWAFRGLLYVAVFSFLRFFTFTCSEGAGTFTSSIWSHLRCSAITTDCMCTPLRTGQCLVMITRAIRHCQFPSSLHNGGAANGRHRSVSASAVLRWETEAHSLVARPPDLERHCGANRICLVLSPPVSTCGLHGIRVAINRTHIDRGQRLFSTPWHTCSSFG